MRDSLYPPSDDASGIRFDPPRLLDSAGDVSPLARQLLINPPHIKPLDANVAQRVRAAVLHDVVLPSRALEQGSSGVGSLSRGAGTKARPGSLSPAKLSWVAGTAALMGAGLATLAASVWQADWFVGGANSSVIVSGVQSAGRAAPLSQSAVGVGVSGATLDLDTVGETALGASTPGAREGARATSRIHAAVEQQGNPGEHASRNPSTLSGDTSSGAGERRRLGSSMGAAFGAALSGGDGLPARGVNHPGQLPDANGWDVVSVADLHPAEDDWHGAARTGGSERPRSKELRAHERAANTTAEHGAATTDAFTAEAGLDDNLVRVRPEFRRFATGSRGVSARPPVSNTLEEETRLLEEARSKLGREPDRALELAVDHQKRFRRGQLMEQRRMIHLEALLRLGRDHEALTLAKSIGNSLYRARAETLLEKYGL